MGDVIDVLLGMLKARDANRIRPMSYWENHCVNCGVLAGEAHVREDCPPQLYEPKAPTGGKKNG